MPSCCQELRRSLALFTPAERRDMLIYILGLMVFKYATEAFNGTMVALATVQYDKQAALSGDESNTFQKIGLLQGLNLGMRCLGSILVGPLLARYPTRSVLGGACILLGVSTASLLVLDAVTGGQFKHGGDEIIGNYNPDALIPIHAICGISNGMADLVRAVIPSDMVGGHVEKLQKLDSLVHIFFNIASVCGSITTAMYLIPLLGHNRAFVVTPICCCVCAIFFCCVSNMGFERLKQKTEDGEDGKEKNIFRELGEGFVLFARSLYAGGRILLTSRDLCWLIPCYGVGSYAHRYLDTGVLPKLASRYLGYSSWSMIMCAGSSIGELLGSLLIFFFTKHFRTPIFWLRIDAFFMFALWIAASDVSMNAYVQSSLANCKVPKSGISSLKAVVSFLYCFQIVLYALLGTLIGRLVDGSAETTNTFKWTCGFQYTVIGVASMVATFVPKGACAVNPKVIGEMPREGEAAAEDETEKGEDEENPDQEHGFHLGSPIVLAVDTMPRAMPTAT